MSGEQYEARAQVLEGAHLLQLGVKGFYFGFLLFASFLIPWMYVVTFVEAIGVLGGFAPVLAVFAGIFVTQLMTRRSASVVVGRDGLLARNKKGRKIRFIPFASIVELTMQSAGKGELRIRTKWGRYSVLASRPSMDAIVTAYERYQEEDSVEIPEPLRRTKESARAWEARLRAQTKDPDYRRTPPRTLVRIATDPKQASETRQVAARIAHDLLPHLRDDLEAAAEETADPSVKRALLGKKGGS